MEPVTIDMDSAADGKPMYYVAKNGSLRTSVKVSLLGGGSYVEVCTEDDVMGISAVLLDKEGALALREDLSRAIELME